MNKPRRKRKDKPVYAFVRRGNFLAPDMDFDLRALDGITQGQKVRLNIEHWRNHDRLRAYWATLHDVIDATDCAATAEQLHEVIKIELGFGDPIALPDGRVILLAGSIALENMPEDAFIAYFQRAEEWLARHYGYVKERAA